MANVPITKFAANSPFDPNASAGVAKLIGFRVSAFGGGEAVVELDSGPQHYNPMGTVHGGILCDIADAAMGVAFASTLDADQSFTTLELKINFIRPVWESRLQAKARVVSRGKTVGLIECDVIDANPPPPTCHFGSNKARSKGLPEITPSCCDQGRAGYR